MKKISGLTLYAISIFEKMSKAERKYEALEEQLNSIIGDVPGDEMSYYVKATSDLIK
jgi:hypothetical protein